MSQKKVLIIGSGGREHTLAWALSRSNQVSEVYVAPGNGGTEWVASSGEGLLPRSPSHNVPIPVTDFEGLVQFATDNHIDLTVVGPEVPLAEGVVDAFQDAGLTIFGPKKAAAQLEASKAFSKDFMTEYGVPTGEFFTTDELLEAQKFLKDYQKPVVVKASGLAAGKGVIVCDTREEAQEALLEIMQNRAFGEAGDTVVIEERLMGKEVSVLAFVDGKTIKPMLIARDYKRALDGNRGLNTGGMGAIAPADDLTPAQIDDIVQTTMQPIIDAMNALGTPYTGVLYAGLMLTTDGPKVLEYNCRFGDPETQVILPLLKTDLFDIMMACSEGTLDTIDIQWHDTACTTVVVASPGYPEAYPKGLPIIGLDGFERADCIVFHAGTILAENGLVTSGGRVMAVTAIGTSVDDALSTAYTAVDHIHFENMHYRKDIGKVYTGANA